MLNKTHFSNTLYMLLTCLLAVQAQALPKIDYWISANEVPVYFVHSAEVPMVDLEVIFQVGVQHAKIGATISMMVDGLDYGTQNLDIEEQSEALVNLAMNFSSSARHESIHVGMRSLSDKNILDKSLNLFYEIISKPVFPEDELEYGKLRRLDNIRRQKEHPDEILNHTFRDNVYAGHPYSVDLTGTEDIVKAISSAEIKEYHQRYFVTTNMIILAVGDMSRQQMESIANQLSSLFPEGEVAAPLPIVADLAGSKIIRIPFPSKQVHVMIGQPFIKVGDPDFFALRLANNILGGSGFGSRIMEEIRVKRGLAYSAYSGFITRSERGIFSVNAQTRTNQLDEMLTVMRQIIQDFVDYGPTVEEVDLARSNIRGSFALGLGSNSALMGIISRIARFNLGADYLNNYLQNFESLDAKAVHTAVKRHLNTDKMLTVIVGGN